MDWAQTLEQVGTSTDLAGALNSLRERSGLTHRHVEERAEELLRSSQNAISLSKSKSWELCTSGKCSLSTLRTFLVVCDVPERRWSAWVRAWERSRGLSTDRPPGAVRVQDTNPRSLGVHRAIEVAGAVGELPTYGLIGE